jgi:hypothetical protein
MLISSAKFDLLPVFSGIAEKGSQHE